MIASDHKTASRLNLPETGSDPVANRNGGMQLRSVKMTMPEMLRQ